MYSSKRIYDYAELVITLFEFHNGVDLSLLMKIFNHSSQAITLRYIGITQEQIDDVYVNLDKIL
jgi:hypothetical protein